MSQWVNRIRSHQVWAILDTTENALRAVIGKEGLNEDVLDSASRLLTVIAFARQRLSSTEPALIPWSGINNLTGPLTQLQAHVNSFLASPDVTQLNAAQNQADALLVNLNLIFGLTEVDISSIGKVAGDYRDAVHSHLKSVSDMNKTISELSSANQKRLLAIEETLNSEQQRLTSLISDHQSQFSKAQDQRATDFTSTQAEFREKHTAAATEQQSQFSSDQDSRRTAFADFQRESQDKVTTLISDFDERLKDHEAAFQVREKSIEGEHNDHLARLHDQYKNEASNLLQEITSKKEAVEKLVGVIGNLGVTSGYKKVADFSRWMVLVWQTVTVLALIGLIGVAALVAFPNLLPIDHVTALNHNDVKSEPIGQTITKISVEKNKQAKPDTSSVAGPLAHSQDEFYQGFATRVFLSITFGIFAAYAGKQASRFFEIEQKNRRMALELEALGPFIEPLDKADRDKFRVQIGDRSFGVPDQGVDPKAKEEDPTSVISWLKSKDGVEALTGPIKDFLKTRG